MGNTERIWTAEQENAIEAWDGTLLIPAAAGSGKTSVLVERVIRRMTDHEHPVDADRLLVVTFTRAAAAEMKERIAKSLSELLVEHPDDRRLQRQQILLPAAQFCTIDSFCGQLVREHFQTLSVSPDFRIIEENDGKLLRMEVADEIIEEEYRKNGTGSAFARLGDLVTDSKNDAALRELVLEMYRFIQSHPFPEAWLTEKQEMFAFEGNPALSTWGRILTAYAAAAADYCLALCDRALALLKEDPDWWEKRAKNFLDDKARILEIKSAADSKDWARLYDAVQRYEGENTASIRGRTSEALALQTKTMRDEIKDNKTGKMPLLKRMITAGEDGFGEDIQIHFGLTEALFAAVRGFGARYTERKREKGVLDFSDLIHLVIHLLVEPGGEEPVRTPLARELSAAYDEIMIDEYQDTNEAQDMVFRALSKEETNLFLVGDVKQSIYGFRHATPALFLDRYERYPHFERERKRYPAKIVLDRNFRSRAGVTEIINFLFGQLMTKESCGIRYAGQEELVAAADYPESGESPAELHIIEKPKEEDRRAAEARYIADLIRDMVSRGMTVTADKKTRPVRYGDIVILLRKGKGSAEQYVRGLEAEGIPAWAEESGGFFETAEVSTVVSLLKVIDNANQDIPLLALMLSPIYGFSNEEIARIRAAHPYGSVYHAVRAARKENGRASRFLEEMENFRALAATLPVDRLIDRLYEKTGYSAMVQAMKNGALRLQNLRRILEYARSYAENGRPGLSAFVRFIDRMAENGLNVSQEASFAEGMNVVRVMTVHKAKGLEFPVCILADSVYQHSGKNKANVLLHAQLGLGAKGEELEGLVKYNTLPYEAVRLELDREGAAEELRILYVALTRAKEKLIITAAMENPDKRLKSLAQKIGNAPTLDPFSVRDMSSMAEWIISCALRHPDGGALRGLAGAEDDIVLACKTGWKIVVAPPREAEEEKIEEKEDVAPSEELISRLSEIFSYRYPNEEQARIPSKVAVTDLVKEQERVKWKYKTRPHFLKKSQLTPAEKGTAMHKFMQYADYGKAAENPEEERNRLVSQRFLSPEEGASLQLDSLREFFDSTLGRRILSTKYCSEIRFQTTVPAGEVLPDLDAAYAEEPVVLNGVVDCVLLEEDGLVVIDYKTDRVEETDALAAHYRRQLDVYAKAMEECLEKKVKERIIYSFHLGKSIVL